MSSKAKLEAELLDLENWFRKQRGIALDEPYDQYIDEFGDADFLDKRARLVRKLQNIEDGERLVAPKPRGFSHRR